jgi:hypothetical protein
MRELDHRSTDDIEVTLVERANQSRVRLGPGAAGRGVVPLRGCAGGGAGVFHHPYAYAQHIQLAAALAA